MDVGWWSRVWRRERERRAYPGVDFALVLRDYFGDVVFHDFCQLGFVGDAGHPARQLRVPYCRVPADELLVGCRPVYEGVGTCEVEFPLRGLCGVPLHAVFGRHLAKIVNDDLGVRFVGKRVLVGRYADVELVRMRFEGLIHGA